MAWVRGLYRDLQPSRDTGDPCREPSDTTESLSENARSRSDLELLGEGPATPRGGEGDLLGPPLSKPRLELA